MKSLFSIFFFIYLLGITTVSFAQSNKDDDDEEALNCPPISNKKAIKLYETGTNKKEDKNKRLEALKKAIELEPDYAEALFLYAHERIKTAKLKNTSFKPYEKYLLDAIASCPDVSPYAYLYLGQIAYSEKKYTDAQKHFERFLKNNDEVKKDKDIETAKYLKKLCRDLADIFEKNVPFSPYCVKDVSTDNDEYLAIISPDNELMFFTRRQMLKKLDDLVARQVEELTYSERRNGNFTMGRALAPPFNKGDNYGGASITPDNRHLYVTVCKPAGTGYLNCDIYVSDNVDGRWSELRNLGPNINSPDGWEAQPSISADGKNLYFAKISKETRGMDIYMSKKIGENNWTKAERLPAPINSDGDEKSPFLHSDSQTLYYSSNGKTGVGGYDIFFVKADEKGNWLEPRNIGYPINTAKDEIGFFVSTDGKTGYFASNSIEGTDCNKGYNIYAFELYPEARPEKVVLIKGKAIDENGKPVAGAKVELKNSVTKKTSEIEVDEKDGLYVGFVTVKEEEDIIVNVKKEGAAYSTKILSSKGATNGKPLKTDMKIEPIAKGKTYNLGEINFATNSATLAGKSKVILDEFVSFLNDNPKLKVAIHGHTDDLGDPKFNLVLSTERAFAVLEYLQEKGVAGSRLNYKGFGKEKPIVANNSAENRAKNRRTEFVILE
jgi:outer membrane protein OmpA-like peptidoglycan-associated protein